MADRALLLASLIFLAGCGSAASAETPPSDASRSSKLVREGDKTRSLQMEDEQQTGEGRVKPPEEVFVAAQGAASAQPQDKGAPPVEKALDQLAKPSAPPTGLRAAVVDSATPLGNGRLTQPQIAKILEKGGDVFGECYTLGAGGANKDFRATVTVKATIGPTGNVNAVEVTKSTANNPKVDACVAQAFKKVKFPAPSDGATSVITFPITFNGIEAVN